VTTTPRRARKATEQKAAASGPRTRSAPARKPPTGKPATRKAPANPAHPLPHDELYARILRFLRRFPNRVVELGPIAEELQMPPQALQLELERLAQRGFVVLPFIEPGAAGGAELAQSGLAWLIAQEGGKPKDVPIALQPAKRHVRAKDEAARLPRADVYGVGR
jgi:hypothetical protein